MKCKACEICILKLNLLESIQKCTRGHLNHPEGQLGQSECQLRGIWVLLSQRRGYLSSFSNDNCNWDCARYCTNWTGQVQRTSPVCSRSSSSDCFRAVQQAVTWLESGAFVLFLTIRTRPVFFPVIHNTECLPMTVSIDTYISAIH